MPGERQGSRCGEEGHLPKKLTSEQNWLAPKCSIVSFSQGQSSFKKFLPSPAVVPQQCFAGLCYKEIETIKVKILKIPSSQVCSDLFYSKATQSCTDTTAVWVGTDRKCKLTVWEGRNFLNQPTGRKHTLNFRLIYQAMFPKRGLGRDNTKTKWPGLLNSFSSSGKLLSIKKLSAPQNEGNWCSRGCRKWWAGLLVAYLSLHALLSDEWLFSGCWLSAWAALGDGISGAVRCRPSPPRARSRSHQHCPTHPRPLSPLQWWEGGWAERKMLEIHHSVSSAMSPASPSGQSTTWRRTTFK